MAETTLATVAQDDPPPSVEEIRALLKRAADGDEGTLPKLRALYDRPDLRFSGAPDVEQLAMMSILGNLIGKDVAARETMLRKVAAVASELAGPHPTAIERLLSNRAAFCWCTLNYYERDYHCQGSMSIKQATYHQARIDAAHRRYLGALKTLAVVRKLAVPAIQVNLARNQVVV